MKQKIFTVGVKLTYNITRKVGLPFRKREKLVKEADSQIRLERPILAFNEDEAVKKYKQRCKGYNYCPIDPFGAVYNNYQNDGNYYSFNNIIRSVVCINENTNYSINDLKKEMTSDDFLHYCSQELGLSNTFNEVL